MGPAWSLASQKVNMKCACGSAQSYTGRKGVVLDGSMVLSVLRGLILNGGIKKKLCDLSGGPL